MDYRLKMLSGLKERLEVLLEAECLDGEELAEAYVSVGYINCALTYGVIIESEDYESIESQVIALEVYNV